MDIIDIIDFKTEYQNNLGMEKNLKFGLEIEMEDIKRKNLVNQIDDSVWNLHGDSSLKMFKNAEVSSKPFYDKKWSYDQIKKICNKLKELNVNVDRNASLQIHYDIEILNDSVDNLICFYKLWSIYENIIYHYSYGETTRIRNTIYKYSNMVTNLFYKANNKGIIENKYDILFEEGKIVKDLLNYSKIVGSLKLYGFSFRYNQIFSIQSLKTIEIRTMNATLDPLLIQNYLKFFYMLLNSCNRVDKDYI